jgi:hypothetical protein
MHILDLDAEGFLGLPNGTYGFSDPTTSTPFPVSLVTGASGSGKTALLDAMILLKESVASRMARPVPARYLRSGARTGRITGRFLLTPEEQAHAELSDPIYTATVLLQQSPPRPPLEPVIEAVFKAEVRGPGRGAFEYFPCNRQLVQRVGSAPADDLGAYRLTRRADKYAGVEQHLARLAMADGVTAIARVEGEGVLVKGDQPDSLAPYRAAFAALCPRLELLRVDVTPDGPVVRFKRAGGAVVDLYRLSQAEQQAVLFATTFLRYGLRSSLVLVDGPELHVHPSDRAKFFTAVMELGEANQIIAATDAPEIVALVPPNQVIALNA